MEHNYKHMVHFLKYGIVRAYIYILAGLVKYAIWEISDIVFVAYQHTRFESVARGNSPLHHKGSFFLHFQHGGLPPARVVGVEQTETELELLFNSMHITL